MNIIPTARQVEILRFLIRYHAEHGYSPTQREIQAEIKASSTSVVIYHLKLMQQAGWIDKEPSSRAVVVTMAGKKIIGFTLTYAEKKAEQEASAVARLAKMTAVLRAYRDLRVQYETLQLDPCLRVERQRVHLKMGEQRCKLFDLLEAKE